MARTRIWVWRVKIREFFINKLGFKKKDKNLNIEANSLSEVEESIGDHVRGDAFVILKVERGKLEYVTPTKKDKKESPEDKYKWTYP